MTERAVLRRKQFCQFGVRRLIATDGHHVGRVNAEKMES